MGRGRTLDPATRDYVRSGGTRQSTTSIETKVYHALRARRGLWVGDPDRGCGLWRIALGSANRAGRADADNEIRLALQPFVDEGLARDLSVTVENGSPTQLIAESSIVDVQAGAIDITDLTRFTE